MKNKIKKLLNLESEFKALLAQTVTNKKDYKILVGIHDEIIELEIELEIESNI